MIKGLSPPPPTFTTCSPPLCIAYDDPLASLLPENNIYIYLISDELDMDFLELSVHSTGDHMHTTVVMTLCCSIIIL